MKPFWLLLGLPALTACAAHADLVEVKTHLSDLLATQEEERKQHEGLHKRLQALEDKMGSKRAGVEEGDAKSDKQRLQSLSARIKTLEDRFSRFEEALRSQTVTEYQAPPLESGQPEMSPQSKPAGLTPFEPSLKIPGTPAITPTSAFNLALNDYQSGRYELALTGFQRFVKDFPQANLAPDAHYWIGETYYSMRDYVRAIPAFEHVVNEYPRSEKVPTALFKLGLATAETGDTIRARTYLKRVIEQYKESTEAKLAKNRLADLR
jgi:tol-pal system protein YbgF